MVGNLINPRFPLIKSDRMHGKRRWLEQYLNRITEAWKAFHFLRERFPELREWMAYPTAEEAEEYLKYRYPLDETIERMTPNQRIMIHSYLIKFESIVPSSYNLPKGSKRGIHYFNIL